MITRVYDEVELKIFDAGKEIGHIAFNAPSAADSQDGKPAKAHGLVISAGLVL